MIIIKICVLKYQFNNITIPKPLPLWRNKNRYFLKKAEVCENSSQKFTFGGNFSRIIINKRNTQWQE
jgi:hypothetical protein